MFQCAAVFRQGPSDFNLGDVSMLEHIRHNYFFSRKYKLSLSDQARREVLALSQNSSLYDGISRDIPLTLQT